MTKISNKKYFEIKINGEEKTIYCWTTPSRYYACCRHARLGDVECRETIYNRTWETFEYESTIKSLANKLKKEYKTAINEFCEAEENRARKRANGFVISFEKAYNKLTDKQKESLAKSDIEITNKEQAETTLKVIEMVGSLNQLMEK